MTGWDHHVTNPLGLCCLSASHTHSLILACYPLCTHKGTHTLSQLNYMSRWSAKLICNLLRSALFSKSHDRSRIIFRPSFCTSITGLLLLYFCLFTSLSLSSTSFQRNQTSERLWLYPCIQTGWCIASYWRCFRKYIFILYIYIKMLLGQFSFSSSVYLSCVKCILTLMRLKQIPHIFQLLTLTLLKCVQRPHDLDFFVTNKSSTNQMPPACNINQTLVYYIYIYNKQ